MKAKSIVLVFAVLLLLVGVYRPAAAGVEVGVSIGLPVYTFQSPPELVVVPGTYCYYPPDADQDILFCQGHWYRNWGGRWYWGTGYNGPWVVREPRYLPSFFVRFQPGWRQRIVIHERIPYNDFNRNWRTWERQHYWEKKHDWWNKERDTWHDRKDVQRDRRDEQRDRKDVQRDRRDEQRDRKDVQRDRRDAQGDRKDMQRDTESGQGDRKDMKRDQQKQQRQEGGQKGQKQQKQRQEDGQKGRQNQRQGGADKQDDKGQR